MSGVGAVACLVACLAFFPGPVAFAAPGPARRDVALVERELTAARGVDRVARLLELATLQEDDPSAVIRRADEAIALLAAQPSATHEVQARTARSYALQTQSAYPEALAEAQRAVEAARRSQVPSLVDEAQYHVALVLWRQGNYSTALAIAEGVRAHQQERGNSLALSNTLRLIGGVQQSLGDLDSALASQLASLQVSEAVADQRAIGRSHNNIGVLYWDLHRYDDALAALRRALAIHERVGSQANLANTVGNLGLVLSETKRPREALPYLERALDIDRAAGNRYGEAKCLNNIGWAYSDLGDPARARQYHQQSLDLREQIGDQEGVVRSRGALAELALSQGDPGTAVGLLQQSIALAERIGDRIDQAEYLEILARAQEATGDVAGAYRSFRQYHEIEVALADSRLRRRTEDLEARYRVREQERELVSAERLADNRRRLLVWLMSGSVLLSGSLLLLGVLYRQRGRAQQALAESEQRYRSLFHNSAVPTFLLDLDERTILDRNQGARSTCDCPTDGPASFDTVEPAWVRHAFMRLTEMASSDRVELEESWTESPGRLRWFELRGTLVTLGGPARWLTTVRDTTEHHDAEAALQREDKMRSLGLLAGGIAHDFNNALTAILGHVELAREADAAERGNLLAGAEQAARAASRVTGQLLAFAKGGQPVRRSTDLRRLLPDAIALAGAGSHMRIDVEHCDGLLPIDVDSGQFSQVVSNLIINAQQATGEGGCLRVRASNVTAAQLPGMLSDGQRYVRIDFADNGPGIPAAIQPRVFEPYFTTKKGGHGLGLAIAYAICRNHGGALTCSSLEGHGATFSVFIPAARHAPGTSDVVPGLAPRGDARILVLDDEPLVRTILERMLTRLGYHVEAVGEGRQAVDRHLAARLAGEPFDLLIMDLTIPGGMGGREALAEILRHDAAARAIVVSGYADDPTMANYRAAGFKAALPKPFQRTELARLIADVLEEERPSA